MRDPVVDGEETADTMAMRHGVTKEPGRAEDPRRAHEIKPAVAGQVAELVAVEVDAGRLFTEIGMDEVASHVPPTAPLLEAIADGRVWVAMVGEIVAGYVIGEWVDGRAHVAQVSVRPTYGRRGLGRSLVQVVTDWGMAGGAAATTLTTFTDVRGTPLITARSASRSWTRPRWVRTCERSWRTRRPGPGLSRAAGAP